MAVGLQSLLSPYIKIYYGFQLINLLNTPEKNKKGDKIIGIPAFLYKYIENGKLEQA